MLSRLFRYSLEPVTIAFYDIVQKNNLHSPSSLRIALAQLNACVGDVAGNLRQILAAITSAQQQQAQLIVFPELVLSGYPPEDLLYRPDFQQQMAQAVQTIATYAQGITVIVGVPLVRDGALRNMACVLQNGAVVGEYAKQALPNYRVFDEKRYFTPGDKPLLVDIAGVAVGVLICEDIWRAEPMQMVMAAGAQAVCVLNASPYRFDKPPERAAVLQQQASQYQCPLAYVNLVGGQDELVFDGDAMLLDRTGQIYFRAPAFDENVFVQDWLLNTTSSQAAAVYGIAGDAHEHAHVYRALVTGVRDYVRKNGFSGVLLGLSGGIDSALTLAIAVDALGAENVEAVMMPFRYTAAMSVEDAKAQAQWLGVRYHEIPIEPVFLAFTQQLQPEFAGKAADVTEENLQARIRGTLLMSLSNKHGKLLLSTSNKSESAVGYATLYGDMAGAFSPLKDVYKTRVYALSAYRNTLGKAIPQRVIDRPPSAELAPGQVDQDSLPPYDELDAILQRFLEGDEALADIIAAGFAESTVRRVVNLVLLSEYKRRQAAPGVRITRRGFGKDWRYPMTSAWRKNLPI